MQKADKRKGRKMIRERITDSEEKVLCSYSLIEAIDLFMNVKRSQNLKERTLKGYRINLMYFLDWLKEYYQEMNVEEISLPILREYVLWCANDKKFYDGHPFKSDIDKERCGLSPASVNVRIRVLKVFFSTLFEEEVIKRNPAEKLSLMRAEQDTIQPLSNDELKMLLTTPNQKLFAQFRDYIIMILMLDTGMRLNEICSLEVNNLDLKARQIILPASKNKNRKMRVLPLSSETIKLLMKLITESKEYFDSNYVFNTNYGEPVNEKTIQKAFSKYAKQAGIEKRVSPHVLRHNFAKISALNGMDIFSLMRILGHSDIATTRKYVQINDEEIRQQHMQYTPLRRVLKRG